MRYLVGLLALVTVLGAQAKNCTVMMSDRHNGFEAKIESFKQGNEYQVILHETESGGFSFPRQVVRVVEEQGMVRFYIGKVGVMPSAKSFATFEDISDSFYEYDPSDIIDWDYRGCVSHLKIERALIHYLVNGWFFYG